MRLLGAILAGGAARRFGSDKALAPIAGRAMVDHVADALRPQVLLLVVVGRDHGGLPRVDDAPGPGLGPLGALLGALRHAELHGFDAVLTAPCDMPRLPADLLSRLAHPPAYVAQHPVVGLWPATLADLLEKRITAGNRAVRAFAERSGARAVSIGGLLNINRPADLVDASGPIVGATR